MNETPQSQGHLDLPSAPLDLGRLINSLPADVNKKVSLHDLKRVCDNYNTGPCPNCYGGHFRPCQWCSDTGVVTMQPLPSAIKPTVTANAEERCLICGKTQTNHDLESHRFSVRKRGDEPCQPNTDYSKPPVTLTETAKGSAEPKGSIPAVSASPSSAASPAKENGPPFTFEDHCVMLDVRHPNWRKGNNHGATSLTAIAREFWDAAMASRDLESATPRPHTGSDSKDERQAAFRSMLEFILTDFEALEYHVKNKQIEFANATVTTSIGRLRQFLARWEAKPETPRTQTSSISKDLRDTSAREDRYVVGFMFDEANQTRVALIRKNKPTWQAGKLNGIGGKLEDGENIFDCMVREFKEETGLLTAIAQWDHYLTMSGGNDDGALFRVDFFVTVGNLKSLRSAESEQVEATPLNEIHPGREDMIENLPWLIGLALDYLQDGRPQFVTAQYPLPVSSDGQGPVESPKPESSAIKPTVTANAETSVALNDSATTGK